MAEEKQKPVNKFRCGGVVATVWKNKQKKGEEEYEFFNINIERNYKDGDEWKKTHSYGVNDLAKVILVAQKAYESIAVKESDDK